MDSDFGKSYTAFSDLNRSDMMIEEENKLLHGSSKSPAKVYKFCDARLFRNG
jgi:hypothetical protein